jgi:hypothetical protein
MPAARPPPLVHLDPIIVIGELVASAYDRRYGKQASRLSFWTRLAVLAAVGLALSACDPAPPNDGLAFRRRSGQQVGEVLFVACPRNLVRNVRLVRDVDKIIGNQEDDILWSITALEPSALDVFEIGGDVPVGFEGTVPLVEAPPLTADIAVIVDLQRGSQYLDLATPLPDGKVLTDRGAVSFDLFEERAADRCDDA